MKVFPEFAVAVNVTLVLASKLAEQVELQLMPAGELVTVPLPAPLIVIVRVYASTNVAVTDWAAVIATVQVPVPEHPPPLQPVKLDPEFGVAVNVTLAPAA